MKVKTNFIIIILLSTLKIIQAAPDSDNLSENIPAVSNDTGEVKNNVNIDTKLLYGQFDMLNMSFSIIQNFKNFTYQLNSDLKRSNDINYNNTAYSEFDLGFTGNVYLTDTWNFLPEIEINNNRYGMYKNSYYSREEMDNIIIKLNNEYKPNPWRWNYNFGFSQYQHRLFYISSNDNEQNQFYKVNGDIALEYVISASNKVGINTDILFYDYTEEDDDFYARAGLLWGFKLIEYFKLSLRMNLYKNHDTETGNLVRDSLGGGIDLSIVGLKDVSFEISTGYDQIPFSPEELFFEQKFVMPVYDLPPGKEWNFDIKSGLNINVGKSTTVLQKIKLKLSGNYKIVDNYYNYVPQTENVLGAYVLQNKILTTKCNATNVFRISDKSLFFTVGYIYLQNKADDNITYKPVHTGEANIKLASENWEVELINRYFGEVYIDPASDTKLDDYILSTFIFQVNTLETINLYVEIDNVLNNKYYIRNGYPEPGVNVIGGIRVVL